MYTSVRSQRFSWEFVYLLDINANCKALHPKTHVFDPWRPLVQTGAVASTRVTFVDSAPSTTVGQRKPKEAHGGASNEKT